jgi:ribonuclease HI
MHNTADLICRTTGCSTEQAKATVESLIAAGWVAPFAKPSEGPELTLISRPSLAATPEAISADLPLTAHTDGACSGNPGPGGWAVVFSQGDTIVAEHTGGDAHTTNNRMELVAIREAVRRAPSGPHLEIATDCGNAIGWLERGWKRNDPVIAALCAEIEQLWAERLSMMGGPRGRITFRHVRGHSGDRFNERADRLATGAIVRAVNGGTRG